MKSSISRAWCVLAIAVVALGARGRAQSVSADESVLRVDVRLVTVDTQVLDRKSGRPLPALNKDDFEVYEDNVRQEVSAFSQDQLPLSIVLLFDLTDSVRPVLKPLAHGALAALEHLKPQDEVAVMAYAARATLIQDFTTDRALAVAAIDKASQMESDEAAFFNEGIFQAASRLEQRNPASRRVIIWLTDDIPNFPSEEVRARYGRSLGKAKLHSENEAMAELFRAGIAVCTLLQRSRVSEEEFSLRLSKAAATMLDEMRYPPGEVRRYAQASGGKVVETSRKRLQEQLALLIDDLRMRYSLGYRPQGQKPAGKFCAIKVKLTPGARKSHGEAVVEARHGYYR